MGSPKLSSLIIGLLILGLLASAIGIFMLDLNNITQEYSDFNSSTINRSRLDRYNRLDTLENLTNDIRGDVSDVSPGTESSNDIIGGFFTNAYTAIKTGFTSATYSVDLANSATEDLNKIGGNQVLTTNAKTTLTSIIIIMIFIGIGLTLVFKWNT